jgi:ABC-type lipoprotein release transport system permease subunit
MRTLLTLGWRNIWRNRRRTLINMSAVGLGLFLVVVYTGLIAGVVGEAKTQLDPSGMGHVEIYAEGFRQRHAVGATMSDPKALLARLQLPPGAQVGARVVALGLATSAHGGQGVTIHGIDPSAEALLSTYSTDIRQGARLSADDDRGILIGERLAERLKVQVGNKVRLMVQQKDTEMGADVYRVRGIFHSAAGPISRGRVLVTMKAAQTLMGVPGSAHQVVIQLENSQEADPLAARLRAQLGAGFEVVTYDQLVPIIGTMERMTDTVMVVMALFVYVLVGLGILNTMLMSVLERTREFGVMRAIGTRPSRVIGLVLAEAFWIATISVAVGLALGLCVTYAGSERPLIDFSKSAGESIEYGGAYLSSAMRTQFSVAQGLKASALVYGLTLLVGLYPAWRVARQQPADSLRAT